MIDLKLARLGHDPKHHDSILDVLGYTALLPEVTPKPSADFRSLNGPTTRRRPLTISRGVRKSQGESNDSRNLQIR